MSRTFFLNAAFFMLTWLSLDEKAKGEELIGLSSGKMVRTQSLLNQGKIVIYIQKNCLICHDYLEKIKNCKKINQELIQIVSLNSPSKTKKSLSLYLNLWPIYIYKNYKLKKQNRVTPTTLFGSEIKIGPLSCQELFDYIKLLN